MPGSVPSVLLETETVVMGPCEGPSKDTSLSVFPLTTEEIYRDLPPQATLWPLSFSAYQLTSKLILPKEGKAGHFRSEDS